MFRHATILVFACVMACGPGDFIVEVSDHGTTGATVPADTGDDGGDEAAGGWGGEDTEPATGTLVFPDMPQVDPLGYCCDCEGFVSGGVSCWRSFQSDCPDGAITWCALATEIECLSAVCD